MKWRFAKADKDGGFAVSSTETLTAAMDNTLGDQTKYRLCSSSHISTDLVEEYKAVCVIVCGKHARAKRLEANEQRMLMRSLRSGLNWKHISKVATEMRNTHGSQRGPFVPRNENSATSCWAPASL